MNTQAVSPTQASDEITDAQLDNVSGGAKRLDYTASATIAARPTTINTNATVNLQAQSMARQPQQEVAVPRRYRI